VGTAVKNQRCEGTNEQFHPEERNLAMIEKTGHQAVSFRRNV
jgi:hypothetical protein